MSLADYIAYETSIGLTIAWGLDETTGTTAAEKSATYPGTYTPNSGGAWTQGTLNQQGPFPGVTGKSATFASPNLTTGGYVTLPQILSSSTAGSISAWAKPTDSTAGQNRHVATLGSAAARCYLLWQGSLWAARLGSGALTTHPQTGLLNQWCHLLLSWGSSAATLYVNGNSGVTIPYATPIGDAWATIGGFRDGSGVNSFFIGGIARVAVAPGVTLNGTHAAALYAKAMAASDGDAWDGGLGGGQWNGGING